MIKVLHVIPSVGPLRGGPSLVLSTMARGLAGAGVQVDIAVTDDNGPGRLAVPLEQPVDNDGVTIWYFPRQTSFYTFSWPLTRWLAQHVGEYDLVHIHAVFSYAALPASIYARRAGVPYIVRPLGVLNRWGLKNRRPLLKRVSFALIERRILENAAIVHYTSEQERVEAQALGLGGCSVVIPLGVQPIALAPATASVGWYAARFPALAGRTIILFLSRLDPKKGLDLLIEAFAHLRARKPQAALVLAGDGESQFVAGLQRQVESLGLVGDVVWAGFLEGAEKSAALAGADMFVLPSYSENYGIAAVEALAAGLPVIISDQVGLADEVARAEAGLVVPCQAEPLAAAMIRLVDDSSLRDRLSRNGRRLALESFSLERATRRLIEVYSDLTREPARAGQPTS